MSDHDPLCGMPQFVKRGEPDCQCNLITKVRADERERIVQIRATVMRDVADELVHTNRVVTLDGVIPWLRDWADHLDPRGSDDGTS